MSEDRKVTKKNHKMGHARLIDSFRYAFEGIAFAFANEQNFRIHAVATILAVAAGFILKISTDEWVVIVILIGIVLMAELFNTAIEATIDLQTKELHPLAKKAKDTASAAVLVSAVVAAVGGLIIFVPRIINLIWK
ncbi:MAG: diacylglycerol kinase family protein [Bacillota bacterium]